MTARKLFSSPPPTPDKWTLIYLVITATFGLALLVAVFSGFVS